VIWRGRIPGDADACAVVASNCQDSDRLRRGTRSYTKEREQTEARH